MLPLVRELWKGDVEHNGENWQFPKATSCPKPVQDNVPMWVAARSPATFDYAVANDCNVMCWPLTMPFSEAEKYKTQLDESIAKAGGWAGTFALMRHTSVYDTEDDHTATLGAIRNALGKFGNLMMKKGDVVNGFPESIPLKDLAGNVRVDLPLTHDSLITHVQKFNGIFNREHVSVSCVVDLPNKGCQRCRLTRTGWATNEYQSTL